MTPLFLNPSDGASPLQHVKTLIGLSRLRLTVNDVLQLIETRKIPWAWDISRPASRRPEVRIWRKSLLTYLAGEGSVAPGRAEPGLAQVIESILPLARTSSRRVAVVSGPELQRRFLCSSGLLSRLMDDGELCRVEPAERNRSPDILHSSAVEFLKRRLMSR